jgi:serine/threonine protein kinase
VDVEVEVSEGPDRGSLWRLRPGERLVIGRAEECDAVLHDARASRRHCLLELRAGGLWLEDTGGRGGTCVLGRLLQREGCEVPWEARIELGKTQLLTRPVRAERTEVPGYRLGERLGEGGSGVVYAALEESSGARVALKLLAPDADEVGRARFTREAALAAQLDHPAIAKIHGLCASADGRPCLVRELVEGESLEANLQRGERLDWRDAVALGVRLAEALEHAHLAGVIHRDVKPGNVILSPRGPKLIDFDLALRLRDEGLQATLTRLTRSGQGLGTLAYLAPEQLRDAHHVGPPADVYGLGVTLRHVLCGQAPFADVEPEDFFAALTQRGPGPLPPALGVPLRVALAIERAHALDPSQRFASAAEFGRALGG